MNAAADVFYSIIGLVLVFAQVKIFQIAADLRKTRTSAERSEGHLAKIRESVAQIRLRME